MKSLALLSVILLSCMVIIPVSMYSDESSAAEDKQNIVLSWDTKNIPVNRGYVSIELISGSYVDVEFGNNWYSIDKVGKSIKFHVNGLTNIELYGNCTISMKANFVDVSPASTFDDTVVLSKSAYLHYATINVGPSTEYVRLLNGDWIFEKDSPEALGLVDKFSASELLPSKSMGDVTVTPGGEYTVFTCRTDRWSAGYSVEELNSSKEYVGYKSGGTMYKAERPETNLEFFVEAYRTFTVAVSEDVDLCYDSNGSSERIHLQGGKEYSFDNANAREYYLCASSTEPVELNYTIVGESEADDVGMAFSVACIGLCVIVFGLLFLSGRKPSWSKGE